LVDDLIKYILYLFGNRLFNKSFYENAKLLISDSKIKLVEKKPSLKDTQSLIQIDEKFVDLFDCFIESLKSLIQSPIKVMLKLIYDKVLELYPVEKNNYGHLFTYLIFNFIINPNIQDMYNISPSKYQTVKDINRVLRNICFNKNFSEEDKLNKYNYIISSCNAKLNNVIDTILLSLQDADLNDILKQKIISTPKFLFHYDVSFAFLVLNNVKGFSLKALMQQCDALVRLSTVMVTINDPQFHFMESFLEKQKLDNENSQLENKK